MQKYEIFRVFHPNSGRFGFGLALPALAGTLRDFTFRVSA
jgi:hypothetical protein